MAKAVATDSGEVMPVCAWVDGEFGIKGVYLGVEVELGAGGVRKVVQTPLNDGERVAFEAAAEAVRAKQADVLGM
jgi:malate dehydrogenase